MSSLDVDLLESFPLRFDQNPVFCEVADVGVAGVVGVVGVVGIVGEVGAWPGMSVFRVL